MPSLWRCKFADSCIFCIIMCLKWCKITWSFCWSVYYFVERSDFFEYWNLICPLQTLLWTDFLRGMWWYPNIIFKFRMLTFQWCYIFLTWWWTVCALLHLSKNKKNVLVIVQNKGMTSKRMYALMYCPPGR